MSAIAAAGRPPLAYSLPGFGSGAFQPAAEWLACLRDLHFRWVTFHPTFPVHDGIPVHIEPGPSLDEAVVLARQLGFLIRIEPHLDWANTLTGGTYEWRRRMYVDPMREYFDVVLAPLAALGPDELTLGSELDVSAYEFADQWAEVAERLSHSGIALGHKLNHDWHTARPQIRRELNVERTGRGLRPKLPAGFGWKLRRYLSQLDYVAISFYPSGRWELDPRYTIGEFGLGSTDITRPWRFDATTFQSPEDFALRRDWYVRFLEWLRMRTGRAASFWTAGHFDVLGVMHRQWRDDGVVDAVLAYNQASP